MEHDTETENFDKEEHRVENFQQNQSDENLQQIQETKANVEMVPQVGDVSLVEENTIQAANQQMQLDSQLETAFEEAEQHIQQQQKQHESVVATDSFTNQITSNNLDSESTTVNFDQSDNRQQQQQQNLEIIQAPENVTLDSLTASVNITAPPVTQIDLSSSQTNEQPNENSNNLLELTSYNTQNVIIAADGTRIITGEINTSSITTNQAADLSQLDLNTSHLHHQQQLNNSTVVDTSMMMENTSAIESTLMVSANLDLDQENESEGENDQGIKEMDDAMSPNISSNTFQLNGTNVSTHTYRKTEWDVKKLENYVRSAYNDMTPMEQMTPELMNDYLKSFFELAKKSDGMDYEPESLIGFMNSFERYLKTKNYPESLLRSDKFKEARNILKKKRDLVRSIGKLIRTKTKDTCYLLQFHRNLLKEKGLLNRDNPDCLLAEIYLNNMIFFGDHLKEDKAWRGNLNLVWGDMVLERDSHGEYLTLATYAKKNSRQGVAALNNSQAVVKAAPVRGKGKSGASPSNTIQIIDPNAPRVYAKQPSSYCPIEAYKVYRSRRPNNCLERDSPFYLAPLFKSKNHSKIWYKALAMSCQRLDALFYCLFKKAGVDLTSLASMSQQQQQQAVAAAASIIGNDQVIPPQPSRIQGSIQGNYYGNQVGGHQHIVTTVPAQVQVQVQVQVAPSHHHQQQQQAIAAQSNMTTLIV